MSIPEACHDEMGRGGHTVKIQRVYAPLGSHGPRGL
jgi:hypothetical protein